MSVIVKLIQSEDTSNSRLRILQKYIAKPEANQEVKLDIWYMNALNKASAEAEMLALNESNSRAKNTFKHLLISFSPEVFPSRSQAYQASEILLNEMGLERCASMVGMHYDKDHVHLHVAVVTIDPDTFKSVHAQWAIEAMHRAAAKINYIQGWKAQDNQLYTIIEDGEELFTLRNSKKGRTLKANEVKTFQAKKPSGEIAAEIVNRILDDQKINNWDLFNQHLALEGIEFQQKGSGSVFVVKEQGKLVEVKASTVNRQATLKKLEIKFGKFSPNKYELTERIYQPIDGVEGETLGAWNDFQVNKQHLSEQKVKIKEKYKYKLSQLYETHKCERAALNNQSWKGRGRELNSVRSVMAANHVQQRVAIQKEYQLQSSEFVKKFHEKYGPTSRFNDYLAFQGIRLFDLHQQQQKQIKRKNKVQSILECTQKNIGFIQPEGIVNYQYQIREITIKSGQKRKVVNFINGDGVVDFIDCGNQILMVNVSKESVKAALQLASQKWTKFTITGTPEFIKLCAEEAIKLKIEDKIESPHAQQIIKKIQSLKSKKQQSKITSNEYNEKWQKPTVINNQIKLLQISDWPIDDPKTREDLVKNAYLRHAQDLSQKPKNDYFRDLEIAIRLEATGFNKQEIQYAIKKLSPLISKQDVHTSYSEHLLKQVYSAEVKLEWQQAINNKKDEWLKISKGITGNNSSMRPR